MSGLVTPLAPREAAHVVRDYYDSLSHGRLVLCGMSPRLTEIFRSCCMDRLFTIARSRREAMELAG